MRKKSDNPVGKIVHTLLNDPLGFLMLLLLIISIPVTVRLVKQRQELRNKAAELPCIRLLQYNECVACNTSRPVFKDSCTGNLVSGASEGNLVCDTLCCRRLLQYNECVACNTSRPVFKDSCTGNLVSGANERNNVCSTLCCTRFLQFNECIGCNTSRPVFKDSCTGNLVRGEPQTNLACSQSCPTSPSPTPTPRTPLPPSPTPTPQIRPTPPPISVFPTLPLTPPPPTQISIDVSSKLPGIGSDGHKTPARPVRGGRILVFNTQNQQVKDVLHLLVFDGTVFKGTVHLGVLPEGPYYVKIKLDNTLRRLIPGIHNLVSARVNQLSQITLIPGDLNNDNILNILDYNLFISCFGAKPCSQKQLADFDDNTTVDGVDYNILIRSFATQQGD